MAEIKVVLLDDKELFRQGLARLLESRTNIEVVWQCDSCSAVLDKAREIEPDVVLIDIQMPKCDGVEVTKEIADSLPKTKVAILTDSEDEEDVVASLKAGASGYLLKKVGIEGLIKSIDLIAKEQSIIYPHALANLRDRLSTRREASKVAVGTGLSGREIEVSRLVAKGYTNKEIAGKLVIAENTVKVHIKNILEKKSLRNKQQVAVFATEHGLTADEADTEEETVQN